MRPSVLPGGAGHATSPDVGEARALIEAEVRWTDAVRRGDREDAGAFMTTDFAMLTAGSHEAPVGRAVWLERLTVPSTLRAFQYDEFRVRVIEDLALVQSRCHESGMRDGRATSTHLRFTDVWQRDGSRWRVALRHAGL